MNAVVFTPLWLERQAYVCVRRYVPTQMDRMVELPFSADDVQGWSVEAVKTRIRYAVRDRLGLHPMVDCFRFDVDVDGY